MKAIFIYFLFSATVTKTGGWTTSLNYICSWLPFQIYLTAWCICTMGALLWCSLWCFLKLLLTPAFIYQAGVTGQHVTKWRQVFFFFFEREAITKLAAEPHPCSKVHPAWGELDSDVRCQAKLLAWGTGRLGKVLPPGQCFQVLWVRRRAPSLATPAAADCGISMWFPWHAS